MKILFVTNVVPNAAGGGTPRRAAMHLEALRHIGAVTIILPPLDGAPAPDPTGLVILERDHALADVRMWRHEGSRSPIKRIFHALRRPSRVDGRATRSEARHFRGAIDGDFDLVLAFRMRNVLWCESVFGRHSATVRVADLDDIESRVLAKRIDDGEGPLAWRLKLRLELRWLRCTERRVARQWSAVSLCSQLDADRFGEMTGVKPWIVPNAYRFAAPVAEPTAGPCRLLFVGTFFYHPNVEGIIWFVDTIWPRVRAALGDGVELTLVGLKPPPAILALGERDGITVAGDAPSVDPYYAMANIVLAPLHTGSGTRVKLIEAAAKDRAIVTTTFGCEGLGFVDGVHAEIADDPADFAARIVALARDPARRAHLAEAARAHARQAFSADAVIAALQEKLGALVAR